VIDPTAKISAAVFPAEANGSLTVHQNWPVWMENDYLDYALTMLYTLDMNTFTKHLDWLEQNGLRERTIPGLGVHEFSGCADNGIILQQIGLLRDRGFGGFNIFDSRYMTDAGQIPADCGILGDLGGILSEDVEPYYPPPQSSFADVPPTHPYFEEIEALYRAGYTAGCNTAPLMFCPDNTMNRAESAVFVERGVHAASYTPADPIAQVFADMPLDSWAAKWVNGLWADQYTAGCGTDPLIYCPWQGHIRAEGCVFYLRMLNGAAFEPPQPTEQTFADVPLDTWYARWVHAAYQAGLTEPCQASPDLRFCPDGPLTRAQAAYMMVRAKGLP